MSSKTLCGSRGIASVALIGLLFALRAPAAVVFTNDTIINSFDTNYDGKDIVVSNCTLTVDGPHGFLSLQVGPGGTLTHSYSSTGTVTTQHFVPNEAKTLTGTTPATLQYSGTLLSQTVTDSGGLITYVQDVDYVLLFPGDGTIQIARTESSLIPDGATVLVSYTVQASTAAGLSLNIDGNVQVAAGGAIDVTGQGYGGASGIGGGHSSPMYPLDGSGGGYGGFGGTSSSNAVGGVTYGLFDQPTYLGSGGGNGAGGLSTPGAPGGGMVRMTAGGSINVDGAIYANGLNATNDRAGGGSGGGIWLSAGSVSGAGIISANGGAGEPVHGGGGGGGRICILAGSITFSGSMSTYGGNGAQYGGAGTVYTKIASQTGLLLVDNGDRAGTNTMLTVGNSSDVLIRGNAGVLISNPWSVRNLTVASNSVVLGSTLSTLTINAVNLTVDAGAGIVADQMGYGPGSGPGPGGYFVSGSLYPCGGGAHGGYGGASSISNALGGVPYDQQLTPSQAGSGGGYNVNPTIAVSGYGGGVVSILVSGTLQLNGKVSVNGGPGTGMGGGGGAGGAVSIITAGSATFSGSGLISANGGNGAGSIGGGGGGGRISISAPFSTFTGTLTAYGGLGANIGGAGTVYISSLSKKQVIADNGGRMGTNSGIISDSYSDLIIRNGAVGVANSLATFASLFIGSNSWMAAYPLGGSYQGQVSLTINGNATIQAGGGINVDGLGASGGSGQGAGRYYVSGSTYYLGGAGYGGYGGANSPSYPVGGTVYGPTVNLAFSGSGGGQVLPNYIGGWGGGYVRLIVTGTLQMDGRISANGGNGSGLGGGGGSGGTVSLSPGTLTGAGAITANGGNGGAGNPNSGGGGGGRISISLFTNRFAGGISAYGGGWTNFGGAGTIYVRTNSASYAMLLVDNGGNRGTNTVLGYDVSSSSVDLTVSGGAVAVPSSIFFSLRNLQVRSNAMLVPYPSTSAQTLNLLNATVDPGGALSADGAGYLYAQGPGSGSGSSSGFRGGGGHGGFGALNPLGRGGAYDSIVSPNMPGSGGGNASGTTVPPFGGAGGGAWVLNVTGTLTVNGRLSANGKDGDVNSGGGSGGALSVTVSTLAGSGVISANGGAGNGSAGGGGGGRIAIVATSNPFTGPITANGGNGWVPGGAGTCYLRQRNAVTGQLFIDNAGLSGTNTPLSTSYALPSFPFNLTISGGASAVAMTPLPVLSNLTVSAGGQLTAITGQTNLVAAVLRNLTVSSNASISVAGRGYPQGQGPGAGASLASKGAGAGYGGAGGASGSGANGGVVYGSATHPIDRGSGGGTGALASIGGSDGGGALRLSVGGTLMLDGALRADGNLGLQDDSGGGSGGSIWISAHQISGGGAITANGGNGDLYGGGGAGGGRIAVYAPFNTFTGLVTTFAGAGANFGQDGTLYVSNNFLPFQVVSSSPSGIVSNVVSVIDLTLSEAVNSYTEGPSGFTLNTPNGPVPQADINAFASGVSTVRVIFPAQNTPGDYSFQVSSGIDSLLGQPLSQVYTGAFTIVLPIISGTVTDTNGQGIAGVLLQPSDVFSGATTDTNGNYSLGVPPDWNGAITPSFGASMFIPSFLSFTDVSASLTGQNFVMVPTIAPLLSSTVSGGNFNLIWGGLAGVTYQAYSSTNLVDWQPVGAPLPGTNGLMQLVTPLDDQPLQFFRIQASD